MGLKFFLLGILSIQNLLVAIRGFRIFIVGISWFHDSKIFSCWLHEQEWQNQKHKNKSQSTYCFLNRLRQLPIVYIRNVLHLLNYLGYYAAFICKNLYFLGSFFFSIRIFSFVIVIHSYCKTTWLIVSLNIQIY